MKRITLSIFLVVTLLAVLGAPVLAAATQQDERLIALDVPVGLSVDRFGQEVYVSYQFNGINLTPDVYFSDCEVSDNRFNSTFVDLPPGQYSSDYFSFSEFVPSGGGGP